LTFRVGGSLAKGEIRHPTRQEYMDGKVSFEDYYETIAQESGISFSRSSELPRIREALANGDEHLNTISMTYWDNLAYAAQPSTMPVLRAHGDGWSLAGGVCIEKAAARKAAEGRG